MIKLRPYQQKLVDEIRQAYAQGFRAPLVQLSTGGGKCLAKGTPVMLSSGKVKPVEEIAIGDSLMGIDSKPRTVKSLASGSEEMFRITPIKGESYTVNRSHILSLKMNGKSRLKAGDGKFYNGGDICNISIDDYLSSSDTFKHCAKGWRVGVDYPERKTNAILPPYILGAWLCDGTQKMPHVSTFDFEVVDALAEHAVSCGMRIEAVSNGTCPTYRFVSHKEDGRGRGSKPNRFANALSDFDLIANKHIPELYLFNSRKNRLELLAGFVDTDGYLGHCGYDLVFKQKQLSDDVVRLARSLGFAAYIKPCKKTCTNTGSTGDYFRISISGDVSEIPCRVKRRIAPDRKQKKNHLVTGITVESVGVGEYFGFELEGDDHLFLLGDFTVTHNTTIFAHVSKQASDKGNCVFLLAHRAELCKQIAMTLARFGCSHQIIAPPTIVRQSQVEQFKEFGKSFVKSGSIVYVCSVQTLVKRLDKIPHKPKLIVCDEAHHLIEGNTWGKIIAAYSDAKLLPVSATPCRTDSKGLGVGSGGFADVMLSGISMRELIDGGFLSPYRVFTPPSSIDLVGVKVRAGDYAKEDLSKVVDKPKITGDVIQHYLKLANGKRACVFCVSVAHAEHVAAEFNDAGVRAESLDGTLDASEREDRIARFKSGETMILTSADLISEGFDLPAIEVAILLRPTQSLALYLQQVGRALRVIAGKTEAIIFDHVGNVARFGMPCDNREWTLEGDDRTKKKQTDEKDVKIQTCEKCYAVHIPAPECPVCGFVYPVKSRELEQAEGELIEVTAEQMSAMQRQRRLEQGRAKSVSDLVAQGISRSRAEKIIQARADKDALVRECLDAGAFAGLAQLRRMKPKELKILLSDLRGSHV